MGSRKEFFFIKGLKNRKGKNLQMVKSLFQKLINNATAMSWAYHVTIFAHGLLVTPLVVIMFSKDHISVWFLLQTIMGIGMLADAGFGFTLARAVSFFFSGAVSLPKDHKEYEKKLENTGLTNFDKLNNLLATSSRIYTIVGLVYFIVFVPVGIAIIWNVMELNGHDNFLWLAYILTMINTLVALQKVKWSSFMIGLRKVQELNRLNTIVGLFRIISFTLILTVKPDIFILSAYSLIETIFNSWIIRRKVLKWFKENSIVRKGLFYFDKELFRSLWSAMWRIGITSWGTNLIQYASSIIVSQVKDTGLIANFLFTQKILGFIRKIGDAPFYANLPSIYGYMAKKDFTAAKKEISRQLFLTLNIIFSGYLLLGFFGNIMLESLGIQIRFVSGFLYTVLALSILLDTYSASNTNVYISTNHIPFMYPTLISGILIISIGFLILPIYGLLGVITFRLIVELCYNYWYPSYLNLKLLNWQLHTHISDIWGYGFSYWKKRGYEILKSIPGRG